MNILIAGCGYIGRITAAALIAQGHQVCGLVRSAESRLSLMAAGVTAHAVDLNDPQTLRNITGPFTDILYCAASRRGGGPEDYRQIYVTGLRHVIDQFASAPQPARVYFTSSTSVYGQNDGSWVDETSPTEPDATTSRILLEAEALCLSHPQGTVLRLAGLYGRGRGHLFHQFMQGAATLPGEGKRHINQVHCDDVAGVILHLITRRLSGGIWNVVDNEPVTYRDYYAWLSNKTGRPIPTSVPEDESTRKRGNTHKRISNRKLREQAGYDFRFPTFREGLEENFQNPI